MAKDRNNGDKQNYLSLLRRNVKEGGGEFFVARLTEHGVRQIPLPAIMMIANFVGPEFLDDVDAQKDSAKAFGVFFGTYREDAENAWIEFWEEVAKIYRKTRHNPDKFQEYWDASKFGNKKTSEENDMADKKDPKKDAKPAPKPPQPTLPEVFGKLDDTQKTAFTAIMNRVTAAIADNDERNGFIRRARVVVVDPGEVQMLLGSSPASLQDQMFTQMVMHGRTNLTPTERIENKVEHFIEEVIGSGTVDQAAQKVSDRLDGLTAEIRRDTDRRNQFE